MNNTQFRPRAYMHRSHIEINNQPSWLTWPLKKPSSRHLIKDLEFISSDSLISWLNATFEKVTITYKKFPFFSEVQVFFDDLISYVSNTEQLSPVDVCL